MNLELSVQDPGPKPDDRGPERARRHRALADLRAALEAEDEARRAAERAVTDRATAAAWLGASLADLATVTGRTRQAARKRWPGLGDVARRRRWLGYHVDEVLWAARLVVEHRDELRGTTSVAVDALARSIEEVAAQFGEHAPENADPTARWRALDVLVDRDLRACLDPCGGPTEGMAGFAVHGAGGVLGYYDAARGAE